MFFGKCDSHNCDRTLDSWMTVGRIINVVSIAWLQNFPHAFTYAVTKLLNQYHACNFITQFCCAVLSRDNVVVCNCARRTLQLCRINMTWPVSVHDQVATKLHRIEHCYIRKKVEKLLKDLRDTPCHTCDFFSRDKTAGVTWVLVTTLPARPSVASLDATTSVI